MKFKDKPKPDRVESFKPKCLLTDRQPAFTATGYLVPCCWVDNPWAWKDPKIKEFYNPKWHIDKHDSVMDIMHGKNFNDWWEMLEKKPEEAPNICKKYCGSCLGDKVTKNDTYVLNAKDLEIFNKKHSDDKVGQAIRKNEIKK